MFVLLQAHTPGMFGLNPYDWQTLDHTAQAMGCFVIPSKDFYNELTVFVASKSKEALEELVTKHNLDGVVAEVSGLYDQQIHDEKITY